MKKLLLSLLAVVMLAGASFATTPIQLSLWDKIAFPMDDSVTGIQLGIGGGLTNMTGLQWNFIWSKTQNADFAWQSAIVCEADGDFTGLQTGFVNYNKGSVTGLQWGALNYSNKAEGLDLGFINYAKNFSGVMIGFINYVDNMDSGLQIGLVNHIGNGSLPWMIIINGKF